jgi:hypothetical protein
MKQRLRVAPTRLGEGDSEAILNSDLEQSPVWEPRKHSIDDAIRHLEIDIESLSPSDI